MIFATSRLEALEKFLSVCWKIDPVTGESNYSIDNDPSWRGEQFLFPDWNVITRVALFEQALQEYIRREQPTNDKLCRFCLEQGFCRKKANESLQRLQGDGVLSVWDIAKNASARRSSFYLDSREAKVRFGVYGDAAKQD